MPKNSAKDIMLRNTLSPYEAAVIKGGVFSESEKASQARAMGDAVKMVGGMRFVDGDYQGLTFNEVLATKMFSYCLENPSPDNVKTLMTISGELNQGSVNVTLSAVDEDLRKRALGGSENDG